MKRKGARETPAHGVALLNKSVARFLRSVYHGLPYHPHSRSEHGLQRLSGFWFLQMSSIFFGDTMAPNIE